MFGLSNYIGHIYQYHRSISKICDLNLWQHVGLVPKDCQIEVPKSWEKVLSNGSWENKNLKLNLISCWKNFIFLKKFLGKRKSYDALFLEHFSVFNVLSLIGAIFFTCPKCQFWILHRYLFSKCGIKTILYKILHFLIKIKGGKEKLILLTDSDLLAKEQAALFKKKVIVVPIPHTNISIGKGEKHDFKSISLWWPGGSTRWEKGLYYINLLSKELSTEKSIKLMVAENAKGKVIDSKNIVYLPTCLCSEEYYTLMRSVDIVLVPYVQEEYQQRTSGIFVEAVASGAKVITLKNTWMSYELEKYSLSDELAIMPDEFCLERIMKINQLELNGKLKHMSDSYNVFHSEKSYASIVRNIIF